MNHNDSRLASASVAEYEYAPLRLPPHVSRVTAAVQLAIAAEFEGWELARVQLYADGTRRVLLRRRTQRPAPSI